jgi:hypothetical protein
VLLEWIDAKVDRLRDCRPYRMTGKPIILYLEMDFPVLVAYRIEFVLTVLKWRLVCLTASARVARTAVAELARSAVTTANAVLSII